MVSTCGESEDRMLYCTPYNGEPEIDSVDYLRNERTADKGMILLVYYIASVLRFVAVQVLIAEISEAGRAESVIYPVELLLRREVSAAFATVDKVSEYAVRWVSFGAVRGGIIAAQREFEMFFYPVPGESEVPADPYVDVRIYRLRVFEPCLDAVVDYMFRTLLAYKMLLLMMD